MVLWHGTRMMGSAHMLSKEKITHKEQKVNKNFLLSCILLFFFFFTRSIIGSGNKQQFDSVASLVKQHGI